MTYDISTPYAQLTPKLKFPTELKKAFDTAVELF
jgi:hypothetical protein